MSTEDLRCTARRAAALMRERAEAATSSPWHVYETANHRCVGSSAVPVGRLLLVAQAAESVGRRPNADHIASWHPTVALAVADWLDTVANAQVEILIVQERAVLAVARAYLGGVS